ncbi:MAG: folate-binding protein [Fimbriimonadales bacterium]|nr:MAG: folate-binding protein [Fimbriimonadales bacterium]
MEENAVLNSVKNETTSGYAAVRETAALLRPNANLVLQITGEDRKTWLQGQITNDVLGLGPRGSLGFCVLKPTGQILAHGRLWDAPESLYCVLPNPPREAVLDRLETMIILEDVQIQPLDDHTLLSLQGPEASEALSSLVELPTLDLGFGDAPNGERVILLRHDRTGEGGWDVLGSPAAIEAIASELSDFPTLSEEEWNVLRLERGEPMAGVDYDERTLVMELGRHFVEEHISFTKGCYTGQEVVERIRSRGHTNRTWVGLRSQAPLEAGSHVYWTDEEGDEQVVGKVTSACVSPLFGPIAAAMLRNEAARSGEPVRVGAVECWVDPFPLSLEAHIG